MQAVLPTEFALSELPHLAVPYGRHLCDTATFGLDLPYASLGGLGFERLCFHLLLSQGQKPRFFGRTGEAQFGIDLIVSDGRHSKVYQCKNKEKYTVANLRSDLELFAKKWLVDMPHLRRPERFILCCAAKLDLRDDWEGEKQKFFSEYGVTVEEWHRDAFDTWLRHQPDMVADLFGDDVAERFCGRGGWNDGLFRPLLPGSGEKDVERYLELRASFRLVHDPATVTRFRELAVGQGLILIEGLSGNGKTMAALDLAASLGDGGWRVFFVSLRNGGDEQRLFEGIKDRCVRPSLFVLDDCHRDLATIERVVSRARHALHGRAFGLVLTAQTAPGDTERFDAESTDFVEDCREQQLTLTIEPTIEQYREILARSCPALSNLSEQGLKQLFAMTAHDLVVLDLLLDIIEERTLADASLLSDLFPSVLRRYFGHEKVYAPALKALAAVAQYDIAVPLAMLPQPFEAQANQAAVKRLTVRIGQPKASQPASLAFAHASAAQMIFRAISWADADLDWVTSAAEAIVSHLFSASDEVFKRHLEFFLRGRLRISNDSELKQAVLMAPEILARFGDHFEALPLETVARASFWTRGVQGSAYTAWLGKRIESITSKFDEAQSRDISMLGAARHALALADPAAHAALDARLGAPMLRLIRARGTIVELLGILSRSTPGFVAELIAALDPLAVTELIDRTIAEGRSIGTLSLSLRKLVEHDKADGRGRLAAFEARLGCGSMLRLIRARGTIVELLGILSRCTPSFAAELIAALDPLAVTELIDKTIAEGRSIGTLPFSLRELAERDLAEGRSQLAALEVHLGKVSMLRLIRARGTIVDLFQILKASTPGFAAELIAALDPLAVSEVIDKTIGEGRSIGALDLALATLAERHFAEGMSQLAAIEVRLGGASMLRLIRARGTIIELIGIARRSTPGFAAELITAVDPLVVTELIDRAIVNGRSIGTLGWVLKNIRGANPDLHNLIEAQISIEGFWRLVLGVGDLNDLTDLLDGLTPSFSERLLAPGAAPNIARWADLLRRGGFYAIARFVKDSIDKLPAETLVRLEAAVAEVIGEIVKISSWQGLSMGLVLIEQATHVRLRTILETVAFERIETQEIDRLIFDDFMEAASGLFCLWRRRETLRPELGRRFWTFIPEERLWPEDYSLFVGGQLLLQIGKSEHVSQRDTERLLQASLGKSNAVNIGKILPGTVYLFIWNQFGLWHARGNPIAARFADLQSDEFWKRVEGVVAEQATRSGRNSDKLNVLALAGLLTFVLSGRSKRLSQALRGQMKGVSWLIDDAETLTFVPAVLALKGLSLIDPYQARFSADRRRRLLAKATDYDERGPAIEFLCKWLRRDDRYHQPSRP